MIVEFSSHVGDPRGDKHIWPLQKKLNEACDRALGDVELKTLRMLSIVFRVSGSITDFGGEGPERMKHRKRGAELTTDLVIPESHWRDLPKEDVESHVLAGVRVCVDRLVAKAESLGEFAHGQREGLVKSETIF